MCTNNYNNPDNVHICEYTIYILYNLTTEITIIYIEASTLNIISKRKNK